MTGGEPLDAWQVSVIERLYAAVPGGAAAVLDLIARVNELAEDSATERDEVTEWASTYRGGRARRRAATGGGTASCASSGNRT